MAFGNLEAMLLGNLDGLSIGEKECGEGLKSHVSVCFLFVLLIISLIVYSLLNHHQI